MIIYPDYYYKFKCIANKCKHNCCIGWEIDIDEQTMNKYFKTNGFLGKKLKENTSYDNNTYHFVLSNNERCPFLNDNNLCEIIETLGEDMLCQICSDHPRFRNYFDNRTEIGLGICCEHAAEIILTNKNKVQLTSDEKININDSFYKIRESIFDTLQNRNIKLQQRIENMLNQFGAVSPVELNKNWKSIFKNLERFDINWDNYLERINPNTFTDECTDELEFAYEQLIVYFVFRHLAESLQDGMFTQRLSFIALCYYIIKSMNVESNIASLIEISRMFSCEIEYSDENVYKLIELF